MTDDIDELDKQIIRQVQGNLPLVKEPYREIAESLNITEQKLLRRLRRLKKSGRLRRIGGVLYHRNAGYNFNGMAAWNVPEAKKNEAGQLMAAYGHISHVFERPTYPDWPYNIFSIIHGQNKADVESTAESIAGVLGIDVDDYLVLYSTEELKKTSMRYFVEDDTDRE